MGGNNTFLPYFAHQGPRNELIINCFCFGNDWIERKTSKSTY